MKSKLGQPVEVGDVVAWAVSANYGSLRYGIVTELNDNYVTIWKWGYSSRTREKRVYSAIVVVDRLTIPDYVAERKRLLI